MLAHGILLSYDVCMSRYPASVIEEVRRLRSLGKTYGEINYSINAHIPKSTLSDWCKHTPLPREYAERIQKLVVGNLDKARIIALEINRIKREEYIKRIRQASTRTSQTIDNLDVAKVALAMLCLGEASKSVRNTSFYLGNSDPKIIVTFLELLKRCFTFDIKKVRCTVQCRADQNAEDLVGYWMDKTKIPRNLFYKTRIDPRTIGKPTKKKDYKGVLRVDYLDNKVRLELESLAELVYNRLINGPVA